MMITTMGRTGKKKVMEQLEEQRDGAQARESSKLGYSMKVQTPSEVKPLTDRPHRINRLTTPHQKKTYREALLSPPPLSQPYIPQKASPSLSSKSGRFSFKGWCFRCLGKNHLASHCRDPFWCTRCFKSGHKARLCVNRLLMNVYWAMRACPAYLSAFIPLSDDFFGVIPPANLGHFPQDAIANGLASRFGGYPTDFVIFLPEWVPSDHLIHMDVLNLGELRLRCFPWDLYRGARRPPLPYKVWIQLVSLLYECWCSRTVAALVGGFSRFIRADDFSARMVDLSGYRYLIAVNHFFDILENLEITFGDLSISVLI
uniref:CCHC-type domain-containing protein n=1 Tax=Ananas comosus var. bracteatus TaxID=296719 RepID=A0A6V7PER2_ANACO|nr:unnamed protein product [Ananas comosus var. bracteatus]